MSQKLPVILAEKIAAKSRIFTVQAQHLAFANGTEVFYERLLGSQGGAVLIIPLLADGNLLLVREFGAGVGRYELGFPKGKVDPGETWREAALRESQEEIGFLPKKLVWLDSVTLAAGYMTHQTHIVLATDLEPSSAIGDEPEPLQIVPWPLERWAELLSEADFSEGRAYAALLLLLKHLGKI
ncbi:MAG: ADP compounds hydrolase NudE [Thiotrichales bacterium]|nr:ADP compounds hydrolase NudE [Thiotrichales bacterium]